MSLLYLTSNFGFSYCGLYDCALLQLVSVLLMIYYRLYSRWKFLIFLLTSFLAFLQIIILSGEYTPLTHAYHIKGNNATCPSFINNCVKVKYPLRIFVTMFKPLCSKMSQKSKSSHATTKLTLLTVSKDEWNTKEDTG